IACDENNFSRVVDFPVAVAGTCSISHQCRCVSQHHQLRIVTHSFWGAKLYGFHKMQQFATSNVAEYNSLHTPATSPNRCVISQHNSISRASVATCKPLSTSRLAAPSLVRRVP